ncbi:Cuticular protein 49Af [Carabus blaptoides fortunei]
MSVTSCNTGPKWEDLSSIKSGGTESIGTVLQVFQTRENHPHTNNTMKFFIAFVALFYVAFAASPSGHQDFVPIVSQDSSIEPDGSYHYNFETADGTKAEQAGTLKVFDKEHAGQAVNGRVSYQGDDGKTYTLTYTADENGFQPQGDHIPVAPPVPEPILRALQYIAQHPSKEQF